MQELMNKKIWFCWNYKTKNGKNTKVPCSAKGDTTGTTKNHSCTWVTYEDALNAKEKEKFSGTGFVIPEGYFFLDIDNKEVHDPFVQNFLSRFNSYAEHSVSGTGIHIYGKCDISKLPASVDRTGKLRLDTKYYMKNSPLDLELYMGGVTNRFAAFTGNIIENKPLKECTTAVLTTLNREMLKNKPKSSKPAPCSNCDVDSVIKHLKSDRNHDKFIRLFDKGDITGYGSQSEADLALCTIVAFRAGNNPDAIDSIFRMSALMREKWDREDYRDRTIEKAIEGCHGVFHYSVKPRPEFVKYQPESGKEIVLPTILARHIRNDLHYIFVRDNGRQGVLRYVYENGCYRYYSDDMLLGLIKQYIVAYNEDIVKMSSVKETFGLLTSDLNYVNYDELNSDEDIINFENGILRLSDMALLPHSPDYLSTIQIPCKWLDEAKPTPVFDRVYENPHQ
jgi:primase-polymerase (primpol)-like protein